MEMKKRQETPWYGGREKNRRQEKDQEIGRAGVKEVTKR